jgi:tRNA(Ile)-lysidine synthase
MKGLPLERRFAGELRALGLDGAPGPLLVAVSGGLDSTVLLHLLRFHAPGLSGSLTAAHFDHRMRPDSAGDAAWVRGLCRAWGVPLREDAAREPLSGEDRARRARHAFLREAAASVGASLVCTAHHADDQAETVLFRVLRGTGMDGLRGMAARTPAGIVRPLLAFWREELEAYAAAHRLRWRTDSTNLEAGPSRNRIRLRLLPEIERTLAPSARRNLVALADLARESEAGWSTVVEPLLARLERLETGGVALARRDLRGYDPAVASRVLRAVLEPLGVVLDRAGTRLALQFITDAPSGRELQLPRGVRIRIEHDRALVERASGDLPPDETLRVEEPAPGRPVEGRVRLGGARYGVRIDVDPPVEESPPLPGGWRARVPLGDATFPLELRARRPGDRVRTGAGSRSLRRLMIDRRVPLSERKRLPVLADAHGVVLWVAGLFPSRAPRPSDVVLNIRVANE